MRPHLLMLLALFLPLATAAQAPATPTSTATTPPPVATPVEPAPAAVANPRVKLTTSLGEIVVELDAAKAPRTVENFLAYARDGHYNGTIFHRVVPDLLVQAGGFTPDLQHKPTRAPVASEAPNGLSNLRGTLAAARQHAAADSATAQFFINTVDNPDLDFSSTESDYTRGYTVFGRVLLGMDVVDRIRAVETAPQGPFPAAVPKVPVLIERVDLLAAEPPAP